MFFAVMGYLALEKLSFGIEPHPFHTELKSLIIPHIALS